MNPSLAADSTLGTGQILGPLQHPGIEPEPVSPSLGVTDSSWEHQQARGLDPGPQLESFTPAWSKTERVTLSPS